MGDGRSRILVVDASEATADALARLLVGAGHQVELAADGPTALALCASSPLDLVLISLEQRSQDGLQLLKSLRTVQPRRWLPVMILTPEDDQKQRIAAYQLGADDVLHQPWNDEELLARARRALLVRARLDELLEDRAHPEQLPWIDQASQLANRRRLEERLREEFRRAQRYDDPLAVVLLELEPSFADPSPELLKALSSTIAQSMRATDLAARLSSQQFAILLPKTHLPGALTVAERLRADLQRPPPTAQILAGLRWNLGVSGHPNKEVFSAEGLLRAAEAALLRAKKEGSNRIGLFLQSFWLAH